MEQSAQDDAAVADVVIVGVVPIGLEMAATLESRRYAAPLAQIGAN